MPIRVIAGSAKGRRLKLVPGENTRPVMDRVKEALFSILGRDILQSRFLDLFAGTGSVGIEALSRGAEHALFVELDRRALETIRSNLELTQLSDRSTTRRADVLRLLQGPPTGAFDFIYIAPPQYRGLWLEALRALDQHPEWLAPGATVIVQIDPLERAVVELEHLESYDERRYGNTLLWFFNARMPSSNPPTQTVESRA